MAGSVGSSSPLFHSDEDWSDSDDEIDPQELSKMKELMEKVNAAFRMNTTGASKQPVQKVRPLNSTQQLPGARLPFAGRVFNGVVHRGSSAPKPPLEEKKPPQVPPHLGRDPGASEISPDWIKFLPPRARLVYEASKCLPPWPVTGPGAQSHEFPLMIPFAYTRIPWFKGTPHIYAWVEGQEVPSNELQVAWKIRVSDRRIGPDQFLICEITRSPSNPAKLKEQLLRWHAIATVLPVARYYPFNFYLGSDVTEIEPINLGYRLLESCSPINWQQLVQTGDWDTPEAPLNQLKDLFRLAWEKNLPVNLMKEHVGFACGSGIVVYTDFIGNNELFRPICDQCLTSFTQGMDPMQRQALRAFLDPRGNLG